MAITTRNPISVEPEAPIATAIDVMVERKIRHLSVVDSAGEPRHLDRQHGVGIKLILLPVGLVGMIFVCFAIALAVLRLGVGP